MKIELEAEKLRFLIEESNKILITSHVSPDPDAVSSSLLLGLTLKKNFPKKRVSVNLEELPQHLGYLPGFSSIENDPLVQSIQHQQPDLIILVDAMNFERCSRRDVTAIDELVEKNHTKIAIIDHHEKKDIGRNEIYINQGSPAAVEDIYEICFDYWHLEKPEHFAEVALTGLYADTGGFVYLNDRYEATLEMFLELLKTGVSVERVRNRLNQYTEEQMQVIGELAQNVTHYKDCTYTFLGDIFLSNWIEGGHSLDSLHSATKPFLDSYIRNIEGRDWGFIVYKDPLWGENIYSVSFRALSGKVDVARIARSLNGGGHKAAAGGKLEAQNIEEALQKVKADIDG